MGNARVIVAGTHSGVGKTTITLGLMAAFVRKGLKVQGFKAGPDFIDPGFHTSVTGRPSRNLDGWMTDEATLQEMYLHGGKKADLSIIEGVMGLYDGKEAKGISGSTAELAIRLKTPVLLVIDAGGMARSAAAIVLGFQSLEPDVAISGVIANRVGGEGHFHLLREAIESACGIPVLGYLPSEENWHMPERHLGLVPAAERAGIGEMASAVAARMEKTVDLDRLLAIAEFAPDIADIKSERTLFRLDAVQPGVTIAIARDAAFHFYYPENLELLERCGAKLAFFRPVDGETIPADADGLYIGGGFPEEFAECLSRNKAFMRDLHDRILAGLPTFAECGGYMLLMESLMDRFGRMFPMAGVVPGKAVMQDRLAAIGYREVTAFCDGPLLVKGERARGHEFHYSVFHNGSGSSSAYCFCRGGKEVREGYALPNLTAGYVHLHFASNPGMAERFVQTCRSYQNTKVGKGG